MKRHLEDVFSQAIQRHASCSMADATTATLRRWEATRDYGHAFLALDRLTAGDTSLLTAGGDVHVELGEAIRNGVHRLPAAEVLARALLVGAVAVGGGSPQEWPAWRHMVDHGRRIRPAGGSGPFHPVPGVDTPTTARKLYAALVGVPTDSARLGTITRGDAHTLGARFGSPAEHWGLPTLMLT
jgi:hypothetical protein